MKITAVLLGVAFVVSTVCAKEDPPEVVSAAQEVETISTTPITTPTSNPHTTTPTPSTNTPSTTPIPSTNTPNPPSTTPTPSTTTPNPPSTTPTNPPSTTPTPSTTTPNPPSTTPIPSTTTPNPSSTTPAPSPPKPSPKPVPIEYYWNVTDDKGAACILAKADITLKLAYSNVTASGKQFTKDIKILPNATSSGMCSKSDQSLQLTFGNTSITFSFHQNETGDYHLSRISSNITLQENLGNQSYISLASDDLKVFTTKLNTSYECRWSEPAILKEVDQYANVTKATLHVNMDNIRFEAFRNMTGNSFAQAYTCEMDNTDLVPIMVGLALGILVAVVLIAYLVGRRSTQAQGYLSM